MEDVGRFDPTATVFPKYNCLNQGIQAGWYDNYGSGLTCQWVDITGVPPGTYTLEVTVNPFGALKEGNYANNIASVSVTVTNTLPTLQDIANQSTLQNTPTPAIPVVIWDGETDWNLLTLSATSSNPTLLPVGNIVFGGSGANRSAVLTPASNQGGSTVVSVIVSDANGGTATNSFTFNVSNNHAPVVTVGPTSLLYVENDAPTVIEPGGTVTDSDNPNFNGGWLTVDFLDQGNPEDRIGIRNQGTAAGQIGVVGNTVTSGGVTIGTFSGGTDGVTPLVVLFTSSSATVLAAQSLLTNIVYWNTSENPVVLPRTVRFLVDDGNAGFSASVTKTVQVVAVNDAPITVLSTPSVTYSPGSPSLFVDDAATVSDADSPDFQLGMLEVALTANGSVDDRLSLQAGGQVSVLGNAVLYGGAVLGSLSGGTDGSTPMRIDFDIIPSIVTPVVAQALIRCVVFWNATPVPTSSPRTVEFRLSDGDGGTNKVSKTIEIGVSTGNAIVFWNNPVNIIYGTPLSAVQLNATANVPGTFVYTPPEGAVLSTGNGQILSVTFTPTDLLTYTPVTKTVHIDVLKATPAIVWVNPASIVYGAALGASQLNASASTPGSFVYTPPQGTVLHSAAGQSLSVFFTPTDTANYTAAEAAVGINVTQAPLAITALDVLKVYGAALPALGASYVGFVNGDTSASLDTPPSITTTGTAASSVGTYPIQPSGAADQDYAVSYVSGVLTVTAAPLVITADSKTRLQGAANPPLDASYASFVNGDTSASLSPSVSLSTTAIPSSPVGVYPITASAAANPNYSVSFVPGTLSVTAPPLVSISVTPATSSTVPGQTVQYVATGTYSDSSTADLSATATWLSSIPAVATVNVSGLATAVTPGSTEISATYSSITGSATLTVTGTLVFSNPSAISVPLLGIATPYPSTLQVSGVNGSITQVTISLLGISHTYPDDLDILLVGPAGQKIILMSDAGGNPDLVGVNLTFDDAATASLPDSTIITSGTYKPTGYEAGDPFAAPAPAAPYATTLSSLLGTNPNGTWSLYVVDDATGDLGSIAGGWQVTISTRLNTPPTLSDITDVTVLEDTPSGLLNFTVGDGETLASNLSVSGSSSNPALVPKANLVFGGSGTARTLVVTPAANQFGTTTITVSVSDGSVSTTDTFVFTVTPVDDLPTISAISDQATGRDFPTSSIGFTVGDVETPATALTLSGVSSDQAVVLNSGIVFGGSGSARTVVVTPAPGATGSATISITVLDGTGGATSTSFVLVVSAGLTQLTVSNPALITIPLVGAASTYPSTLQVAGMIGTLSKLTLKLVGLNHTYPDDLDLLLVGPGGQKVLFMSDAGGNPDLVGVNLTFDDSSSGSLPDNTLIASGSYKPTTFEAGDVFPAPAPASPYATAFSAFVGSNPNGNWSLYIVDDANGDQGTLAGGWSLAIGTGVNAAPTISDIHDLTLPEDTSSGSIGFTIGDAETAAASLTVSGTSSNPTLVPKANLVLGGSGANRTLTFIPATNQFGSSTVTVTVSDGFASSSDTFVVTVTSVNDLPTISAIGSQTVLLGSSPTPTSFTVGDVETAAASLTLSGLSSNQSLVPDANITFGGSGASRTVTVTPVAAATGSSTLTLTVNDGSGGTKSSVFVFTVSSSITQLTISNPGSITIPDIGSATPYPSTLLVSGMTGTITKVTLSLFGISHTYPGDIDILLVAPGGQKILPMSDTGGNPDLVGVNLSFDDAAVSSLPNTTIITSGTYKPTNFGAGDVFASPAPAAPYGAAFTDFNGSNPNGTWSLYVTDGARGDSGVIAGGWLLNITTSSGVTLAGLVASPPSDTPPAIENSLSVVSVTRLEGGHIHLTLRGQPGWDYVIECSSDMVQWAELSRGLFSTSSADFIDRTEPQPSVRFYRAKRTP